MSTDDPERTLLREAIEALRESAGGDAAMAEVLRGLARELEATRAELAQVRAALARAVPYLERLEAHDRADDEAGRAQAREEGRREERAAIRVEMERALDVPRAAQASTVELLRSRGGKAALGAVLLALVAAALHALGVPTPAALQALLGGGDAPG